MGTRQLVVKGTAARPRVAEPLFMAYDSAAHEPARVPTRGPDGHAGHRAAVSRLPGAWARRPRRVRGLRRARAPGREPHSALGTLERAHKPIRKGTHPGNHAVHARLRQRNTYDHATS